MASIDFDGISQQNIHGELYWSARDLWHALGYKKWQRFEEVLTRAQSICSVIARQNISHHFAIVESFVVGGHGGKQKVIDYHLSRYAVHLVLACSDMKKPEIALTTARFTLSSLDANPNYMEKVESFVSLFPEHVDITKEQITIGQIKKAFQHVRTIQQYAVPPFRIDLYFSDYNIAIECDEEGHRRYAVEQERARQHYIEENLGCTFIRYNPDAGDFNIGEVINQIMLTIYQQ